MTLLYRTDPMEGLQLRDDEAGGPGVLSGPAMVYGDVARRPGYLERFDAGALVPYERGVYARYMHQRHMPLARLGRGMTITDTPERMEVEIVLPDTQLGQDTARMVRDELLQGLSLEFAPVRHRLDGQTVVHSSATLVGVSVVDIPSYPQSTVQLREELLAQHRRRPWL